ncbi:hypothetical protein LQL77_31245 [Rhodococcus cerastii]|nr:hypothetical protein [Rhodococcus cerastii]
MTNSNELYRIGRAAVVSTLAASAIAALGGGVAAADQAMPDWYNASKITTTNCQAPVLVDDNHVQLHCHSTPGSRVTATVPFGTSREDRKAMRVLAVEVGVPDMGRTVSAFLYNEVDTKQFLPLDSRTVPAGEKSKPFIIFPHMLPDGQHGGHTLNVHTLFGETDVVLTVHPSRYD